MAEAMLAAAGARDTGKVKLLTEAHRRQGIDAQLKNSSAAYQQLINFVVVVVEHLAIGTPLPTFFHRANVYSKCPRILVKDLEQPPEEQLGVPVGTWFLGTPAAQRKTEDGEGSWKQEQGPVGVFMVQPDGETTHLLCYKTNFSYKPAAGAALAASDESRGWCMHEIELVLPLHEVVVLRKVHRSNRAAAALRKGKAVAPAEEARLSLIAAGGGGSPVLEELEQADKNVLDCASQTIDQLRLYMYRSIVSDSLEVHPGQVAVTTKEMISAASSAGVKRKAAKVISEKKTRAPPGTRQSMSTETDRDDVELSRHDKSGVDSIQTELENALVWARNFPVSAPEDYNHPMPFGVNDSSGGFLDEPLGVADYLESDGGGNPAHGIPFDAQVEAGQKLGPEAGEMAEEAGGSAPRTIVLEETELTSHQEISPDMYCHRPSANEQFPLDQRGSEGIEGIMPDAMASFWWDFGEFDGDRFLNNLLEDA